MKFDLFAHAKEDKPFVAIGLLLIATLALSLQDGLVKWISAETSFWQIQTLRSLVNMLIAVCLAYVGGGLLLLKPRNWRGVYLRAFFLVTCMFFFFAGAPFLSMTQMAAGLYTYPLFVCLMASSVLGESIGKWRIASIILGACGALIVLSPWHAGFSSVQVLPVIAGFFFACNILALRRTCRHESTLALAFAAGVVFMIVGLSGIAVLSLSPLSQSAQLSMPFVAIAWPKLSVLVLGMVICFSVLNLTGNICLTRAYQTADASLLAPLDYTYLIFATLWGKVIFGKWPSINTLAGMCLIVCAGVVIAWRERHLKQNPTTAI